MGWARQKKGLELIRVINQKTKKGGCRTRNGEALNNAFERILHQKRHLARLGVKKGVYPKQAKAKTGSSGEPVLRDTLNIAVNEGG